MSEERQSLWGGMRWRWLSNTSLAVSTGVLISTPALLMEVRAVARTATGVVELWDYTGGGNPAKLVMVLNPSPGNPDPGWLKSRTINLQNGLSVSFSSGGGGIDIGVGFE